jgi:hypothetical protein
MPFIVAAEPHPAATFSAYGSSRNSTAMPVPDRVRDDGSGIKNGLISLDSG